MLDIDAKRREIAEQYFDKLIPSKFHQNQNLMVDIFYEYLKSIPFNLSYYYDLQNATGGQLDIIAYNFFSIKRNFQGNALTDNELVQLISFATLSKSSSVISEKQINDSLLTIFGNDIQARFSPGLFELFIASDKISKAVFDGMIYFDLIPRPAGSKIVIKYQDSRRPVFTLIPYEGFQLNKTFECGFAEVGEPAGEFLDPTTVTIIY